MRPREHATAGSGQAGFSLTEIMVMLVVIGIGMAIALPNLHRANETWRLKESVTAIETTLRSARSTAVTRRVPVRVRVDVTNRECLVEIDSDENGSFETALGKKSLAQSVLVESVNFGGETSVVFDERGAPENPGSVIIRTRDGDGREVLVSAGSGSVAVFPYQHVMN